MPLGGGGKAPLKARAAALLPRVAAVLNAMPRPASGGLVFVPVGPLLLEEQTPPATSGPGLRRLAQTDRHAGQHLRGAYDLPLLRITITMYFDDHDPPHFHARHATGRAKVEIESLEIMDSTLERRQLRFVLAWAELHQDELLANWRRARAGETLEGIEPLR